MLGFARLVLLVLALTVSECANSDFSAVTCGSTVKFINSASKFRVHSHEIKWGSGSGQQSVTATEGSDDPNSLWQIRGPHGMECAQGTPLKFGDKIRLTHNPTKRNLHSHTFASPLSSGQEVSCFGEHGVGDAGDDWEVAPVDTSKFGQPWGRKDELRLRHVVTGAFLSTNNRFEFNQQNCGGQCPIAGQLEVSAQNTPNSDTVWKVSEGIFYPVEQPED